MDLYGRAIANRQVDEGNTVTSVGYITASQRDVIPMIAEQLLRERGVDTVYVIGIQPDTIDVSIRTNNQTYDFAKLSEVLPDTATSGGKEGAGGIKIPFDAFGGFLDPKDESNKKAVEDMVAREFGKRVLGISHV